MPLTLSWARAQADLQNGMCIDQRLRSACTLAQINHSRNLILGLSPVKTDETADAQSYRSHHWVNFVWFSCVPAHNMELYL